MTGIECSIWTVAAIFGKSMPEVGRRGHCPFRKHKRKDKTLSVFLSRSGEPLWKCFSCDPPDNIGDAVGLYARMFELDRKTAWHELRDKGYAVPGMDSSYSPRPDRVPKRERKPPPEPRIPVQGEDTTPLPFEQGKFESLASKDTGARRKFAEQRGLSMATLVDGDVVDVSEDIIGFGYREPVTSEVCRVKMRPLNRKTYWIEPKPPKGSHGAKALGPLYLGHQVRRIRRKKTYAIITEGEIDALSLREVGLGNVVSLPDGSGSATRVNIEPISIGFCLWLLATDADEEGTIAFHKLRDRAAVLSIWVNRLFFRKDGITYKDANEALMAGFTREDFVRCIQQAGQEALGHPLEIV